MRYDLFEDAVRLEKQDALEQTSPYCDLVRYESSVTPGVMLSMLVKKPARKGWALFATHGWHMSMERFKPMEEPADDAPYLRVQVDMRGRAFSQGKPDANGLELWDVFDAIRVVRARYGHYLIDPDTLYFESGSGGGGNAFALAGKFPDLFASVNALCGISDYALWYEDDAVGEFRDEMDVWIGCAPGDDPQAYRARSGISAAGNLLSPLFIAHGETDERVPVCHARNYVRAAQSAGRGHLVRYMELEGVGTDEHWGRASAGQLRAMEDACEQNRGEHRQPVVLPEAGELFVGGFVRTRAFTVFLSDIGKTARIRYDLPSRTVEFIDPPACPLRVTWHV